MLFTLRLTAGATLAKLRQLTSEPDPVLLLGREGRWRWPWMLVGLAAVYLLFVLYSRTPGSFEAIALWQGWISSEFSRQMFPFEPDRPLSYIYDLLCWLPYLLPPLVVLVVIHRVSWRRAFSCGVAFQWRQFWQAALAMLALVILSVGLGYLIEPQQYSFPTYSRSLLPWTVLAFGMIFVQTLGEDVLFQGYLLRTVGAVLPFRIPITAAVIALFVSNHLSSRAFQRDMVLVVVYFIVWEVVFLCLGLQDAEPRSVGRFALDEQHNISTVSWCAGVGNELGARRLCRSGLRLRGQQAVRPPDTCLVDHFSSPAPGHAAVAPVAVLSAKGARACSRRQASKYSRRQPDPHEAEGARLALSQTFSVGFSHRHASCPISIMWNSWLEFNCPFMTSAAQVAEEQEKKRASQAPGAQQEEKRHAGSDDQQGYGAQSQGRADAVR